MSVLRIYKPDQCSADGIPLGWERCRTCGGEPDPSIAACLVCHGHGSLKAAVLAELLRGEEWAIRTGGGDAEDAIHRCLSCSHPMSEGTWNFKQGAMMTAAAMGAAGLALMRGEEPRGDPHRVHYSACDSLCEHGGPGRLRVPGCGAFETVADLLGWVRDDAQASWRPVDIRVGMVAKRTLGDRFDPGKPLQVRPFDLTRENVAVLCLRCFAVAT